MKVRYTLLSVVILGSSSFLSPQPGLCQGFGAISGTVTSSEDNFALAAANIVLQHTILGATSDARGQFVISSVPEGKYNLLISRVGFERKLLSNIVVKANDTSEVNITLAPLPIQSEAVVVTASKRDQSLEEIPVSVSLVDSKAIEERSSITINDALRYVPGVNMVQSQVNIRGMSGYSRGIGSRVLLLLDGLPLLTGDTGEINWETIPTLQVDRIEVVKGSGSALYGSSALGGVINVITRDVKEGSEARVRAYTGAYDTPYYNEWKWSDKTRFLEGVSGSYSTRSGPLAILLSGGRANDDGYRQNDSYHRWNAYGKLTYDFSAYETATLSLNLLQQKRGSFFWWKDLEHALQPDGEQAFFHITTTRWNANASYRKFVGEDFFYTVKGVYFSNLLQNDSMGVKGTSSRAHTGNLELQANLIPVSAHTLTFGLVGDFNDVGSDSTLYGSHADFGTALYFQDEIRFDDLVRVTAGARYDFQKVIGLEGASQFSPKFGLVYSPDKGTTLRASVGRGFRAPSIGEVYFNAPTYAAKIEPNPDLKAERSWSYEVGGSELIADRVLVDGSLFWSEFSDLIEARVKPDSGTPKITFDNVTKARIQGAEVSLKSDWFRKLLHLEMSYTYVWPRDLTENQILRFRPRHLLYTSGSLNYKAFSVGVDFRYISKVDRVDEALIALAPLHDGAVRVPIKVVDARASVDLGAAGVPVILRFNMNNLFQYNYVELMGNVSPIRNFVFSAEARF
jgi:outer membrane receptor for ferrienterochelin and colicins